MPPKPEGSGASVQVQEGVVQPNLVQIPINIPLPSKLELMGDLATNWKKFHCAWNNYKIAARLKDPENPATVNSLVSGHPRELKNVSVSRAVRLRELFP